MIADGHHSSSHSLVALVDLFDFESIDNKNTIQFQGDALYDTNSCAITLNYCTYTNHLGVSPRALYCVVDTSYGLGRYLGHCRRALPKGGKYQRVKTQTQSHIRRPVV